MKNTKASLRSVGKGEMEELVLIKAETYDLIDMTFSSQLEAEKYARKRNIQIIK